MPVTIQELKTRSSLLELEGFTASQVNSVRRTLLADVPKLAIEDVVPPRPDPGRDERQGLRFIDQHVR